MSTYEILSLSLTDANFLIPLLAYLDRNNKRKMYLTMKICICYSASRKNDMDSPHRTAKSPGAGTLGLSLEK